MRTASLCRLLAGCVFIPSAVLAQSDRGTITGTVTDPAGAVMASVKVTATGVGTNLSTQTVTSNEGVYVIPYLRLGAYRVEAEMPGFKRAVQTDVQINAANIVRVDLVLQIGQVSEQIEVRASAPQLRQDSAEVSQQVETGTILALPLSSQNVGRNPLAFAFLTPGVHGDSFDRFKIGGGASNGVEIVFDGLSASLNTRNNNWEGLSPESIAEFRVITNSFDAEYGHTTGGLVSFVSKSGTNNLHGNFYEFVRNTAFDARGAIQPSAVVNRQNNFGGTIGGPIVLPKLYNGANRTFFFAGYEGFLFRGGPPNTFSTLPTLAMQGGNFSGLLDARGAQIPIYDPNTTRTQGTGLARDTFPNNVIPTNRISAVARNIVKYFPQLTYPNQLNSNFLNVGNRTRDIHQTNGKVDHSISDAQKLTVSFSQRYRRSNPPEGPIPYPWPSGFTGDSQDTYFARLAHDYIWRPNLVSQISIGINRNHIMETAITAGEDWASKLAIPNLEKVNVPTLIFSEYPQLGVEKDYHKLETTKLIAGNVSWVTGKHSIKIGADYRDKRMASRLLNDRVGVFTFRPTQTAVPGGAGGNSFASMLLGQVNNGSFKPPPFSITGYRVPYFASFIQDSWKISRTLTLNLGMRWDVSVPVQEDHGRMSIFDLKLPNPGAAGRPGGLVFYGTGPGQLGTKRIYDTGWNDFAPRVGIAWSVTPKTVVRTGYGLFYQPNQVPGLSNISAAGFFGDASFTSLDGGVSAAFLLDNGFPQDFPRAPFIDPTFVNNRGASTTFRSNGETAYNQQWNFGIQRQFGGGLLLDMTYAGSSAVGSISGKHSYNHLPASRLSVGPLLLQNVTSAAAQAAGFRSPYPGFTGTVAQALRPYPHVMGISEFFEKDGHTTYHSLQLKAEKRMSGGLLFLLAYTWSKNLANADYPLAGGSSLFGLGIPQDPDDAGADKAFSPNDIPHRLVFSYVYELPFGRGKRFSLTGPLNHVVGGWQVSAVHSYQSDFPLRFTTTLANQTFGGTIRPNLVPGTAFRAPIAGTKFDPFKDFYVNPGFMTLPASFTYGNSAFNYNYRGPLSHNEDFAVEKVFRLGERFRLLFRGEAFNVLNRVRWAAPATTVGASTFGRVSGQGNAPRTMQLGLKLNY